MEEVQIHNANYSLLTTHSLASLHIYTIALHHYHLVCWCRVVIPGQSADLSVSVDWGKLYHWKRPHVQFPRLKCKGHGFKRVLKWFHTSSRPKSTHQLIHSEFYIFIQSLSTNVSNFLQQSHTLIITVIQSFVHPPLIHAHIHPSVWLVFSSERWISQRE